jgi:medium-chain acyl-[acyl-carrier-protein] hydrolase
MESVRAREAAAPWIVRPRARPSPRIRLFCFPYAGGGASAFRTWPEAFPPEIEICAVQPPGRERRLAERPYSRLSELVPAVAQALRPHLDVPFALFGHSMGAFVCFELTRHLREHDALAPVALFVSACRAPQRPDPHPPLYRLPDADFIAEVGRRYDGIPREVLDNAELLELLLPVMRADFELVDTYAYERDRPLDCPIHCFGGRQDRETTLEELEAWREQTTASFGLKVFPGDHFFLQSAQPSVLQAMSEELVAWLSQAKARVS